MWWCLYSRFSEWWVGISKIIKCSFCHWLWDKLSSFLSHYPVCHCVLGNPVLIGCLVLPVPGHQGNHILNRSVAGQCKGSQELHVYVKELLLVTHAGSYVPCVSDEFILLLYCFVIKLFFLITWLWTIIESFNVLFFLSSLCTLDNLAQIFG